MLGLWFVIVFLWFVVVLFGLNLGASAYSGLSLLFVFFVVVFAWIWICWFCLVVMQDGLCTWLFGVLYLFGFCLFIRFGWFWLLSVDCVWCYGGLLWLKYFVLLKFVLFWWLIDLCFVLVVVCYWFTVWLWLFVLGIVCDFEMCCYFILVVCGGLVSGWVALIVLLVFIYVLFVVCLFCCGWVLWLGLNVCSSLFGSCFVFDFVLFDDCWFLEFTCYWCLLCWFTCGLVGWLLWLV